MVVEARSLNLLTALAANPAPEHDGGDLPLKELVLYIVRVPGSKDVFLTPLKPKDKVVSAEDVRSSLYYVHLNRDGDGVEGGREGGGNGGGGCLDEMYRYKSEDTGGPGLMGGQGYSVQRRQGDGSRDEHGYGTRDDERVGHHGLQQSPRQASRARHRASGLQHDQQRTDDDTRAAGRAVGFAAVRRKPVPGNHALAGQSGAFTARAGFEGETAQDSRPARPFSMPARVPVSAPTPVAATLPSRKPVPARVSLLPQRGEPGLPPPAPVHASATVLDSARPRPLHHNPPHSPQHSSLLTGWSAHRRATLYSPLLLTLIRRDPGSGAQWNVAETRDVLASESTSLDGYSGAAWVGRHSGIAETTASPGEPAIQIDMLTSGYARFHSFDATVAADRQWGEAGMRPPTGPQHSQSAPLLHFPSPTATSLPQSPHAAQGDATVFRRRMRVDSAVSDGSGAGSRRGRGYAFECPWGGRCEFSTGATGRVLKRAVPTTPTTPTAVHKTRADRLPNQQQLPRPVSELRFDLPTLPSLPVSRSTLFDAADRIRSAPLPPHRPGPHTMAETTTTGTVAETGSLDLALAHERAGGGFGGKRAKLGKLVVHADGLRMLDLVVAANVALWWRAYD